MSLERNTDDPLIGAAGFVFQTPVRAKRSKLPKQPSSKALRRLLKRQVAAVVSKRPEVVVRVSGNASGRTHLQKHMTYISRNGKLVAETGDGQMVLGSEGVREIADEWWAMRGENRPSSARDTYNLVLSMPVGADPDKLHDAVREFAKLEFGGKHDYVFVLHTADNDPSKKTKQPHVHLTVRTLGLHGRYLNPRKVDLQAWREGFAAALRRRGVLAEATPRRARGIVQKGTRQALNHMGKRARHNQWKVDQAIKALQKGEGSTQSASAPWVQAVGKRRTDVRTSWGVIATALESQGDVALALQVRSFLRDMPPVRFESDVWLEKAAAERAAMLAEAKKALTPSDLDQGRKR